jgi:SAM-dependent methyltransferase
MAGDRDQAAYDAFGRAYRKWWAPIIAPSAVRLLDRLEVVLDRDAEVRILDVGTGTGTLALAALDRWPRSRVIGVDPSEVMLDLATEDARRRGGGVADRLELRVGTADRLPVADGSVDLAVSSFVLQLVPVRVAALREMLRAVRPGGRVALLTWQADDGPFEPDEVAWSLMDELDVPVSQGGDDRPYTSPAAAAAELRRAGFREVRATTAWLEHRFSPRSFADVVEHWSEEDALDSLDPDRRRAFSRRFRDRLERLARTNPEAFMWRRPLVSVVARRP